MVVIFAIEINSAEVFAEVGCGIYTESGISILSASVIHSHVYPNDIFNQHLILDTQPLTPTNQYNLLGINYPSHIV